MDNFESLAKATTVAEAPAKIDYKSKDLELFNKWKETGSKRDMGNLLSHMSGLIHTEVNRAKGSLPVEALNAEAMKWAVKAIQTYDPTKGTTLSTHVSNYLPKIRRLNYKYQNAVRLPENQQLEFHEYNKAKTQLSEELNRDPTDDELASRIGWSKAYTTKFGSRLYADHIESMSDRPLEYTQFNDNSIKMEYIRSHLSKDELFIWDSIDQGKLSSSEIAAKLGVNINRYNYLKKKLTDKVRGLVQILN